MTSVPKKCGEELRGAAKARRHWRQMGTNWSERALGGWEGRVWQNMEKLWQCTISFFMKMPPVVPIPKIIQTNVRASNQMKMICLYHSGTGKPPSYTSYFGKLATSQKRWPYVNHENQNLFGMTDRETGMGGGCCKMGGPSGNLIRQC